MPHAFRNQPVKGVYLAYELITTLFVRIPWWTLSSLRRSWRPRKSWSLRRAIFVHLYRRLHRIAANVGSIGRTPDYLAVELDVGEDGVWVEPVPELIAGELEGFADAASVTPTRIPGYWMHKKGTDLKAPVPGEKVVYHLHGGAYARLTAHPSAMTAKIPRKLLELTDQVRHAFSIEYRLSSTTPFRVAHPFPTALIDALAGYNYLVSVVGFLPADIIVIGDSAGGNLAHALTRYLVENQNSSGVKMPAPPGGLVLLSPWCDMSGPPNASTSDYLVLDEDAYVRRAFLGPHGPEAGWRNRYISPACEHPSFSISFKGFPRTIIVNGGAELLADQIRTLKSRMVLDLPEEGKVDYIEEPDAVHDYLIFDWHEPERSRTLNEIAKWIEGP